MFQLFTNCLVKIEFPPLGELVGMEAVMEIEDNETTILFNNSQKLPHGVTLCSEMIVILKSWTKALQLIIIYYFYCLKTFGHNG